MTKKKYYVGLDVHKETIAIAYTFAGSRSTPTYFAECGGSNLAVERALRKLAKQLGLILQDLRICYEAGPSGFVLARRLLQLGLTCVVMSRSQTERKPHEKIKTDKRDACKIAKLYRNGDITEVRVPPVLDAQRLHPHPALRLSQQRGTQETLQDSPPVRATAVRTRARPPRAPNANVPVLWGNLDSLDGPPPNPSGSRPTIIAAMISTTNWDPP